MMQAMLRLRYLLPVVWLILLSACATTAPTPNPDGPILTGFDALPKALATIPLSPTTDVLQATPTPDTHQPTATLAPATFTPTPTPYVGNFLGKQTYPAVEGTFQWVPTHSGRVVILTAAPVKPGSRPSPAPIAINVPGTNMPPAAVQPTPNSGSSDSPIARNCNVQPAAQFAKVYTQNATISARLGCPLTGGYTLKLVTEPFQSGVMFWRETKEIYALSNANTFWRVADTWNDTIPASDPALTPPNGTQQPIRGFGYAWRSNPTIRSGLGWALGGEQAYDGFWQDYEHGFMLTGANNVVFALAPTDGPPVTTGQHFGALSP